MEEQEILNEIERLVGALNDMIYKAKEAKISVYIRTNTTMDNLGNPTTTLLWDAFKKLTPDYVPYTGGG